MPMYEYTCRGCGQAFEKRLRMSQSSDQQTCPHCESDDTRKLLGSGFAVGSVSRSTASAAPVRPPSSPFS